MKNHAAINLNVNMRGFMKFEAVKGVFDSDGNPVRDANGKPMVREETRRVLADWFPNQILDAGRNIMATMDNWNAHCQVGTDNTLPTVDDTTLVEYFAGSSNVVNNIVGAQGSPPYYQYERKQYRFAAGTVTANLSEAGVGWSSANGPFLISRALILDGGGTPTTVTPLADEYLDMFYELRYYPPLVDATGTVTLNGVVYNTKTRASLVTASAFKVGAQIGVLGSVYWVAYDGDIGTITQAPSGNPANNDNQNQFALGYVNNSYELDLQVECGPAGWELGAPGIRSIFIRTTAGDFQTQFGAVSDDSPIPKTVSFTMSFTWRLGWTASVIP